MITVKIQGGLGNQMFQFACGKALSFKLKQQLLLDISFYKTRHRKTKRNFQLDNFNFEINYYNGNLNDFSIIKENNINTIESIKNTNLYLDGYWQSESYFFDISDLIRQCFSLDNLQINKYCDILNNKYKTISLHVRRTDYIKYQHIYFIQPKSYYDEAIKIFDNYDYLLVFSDDIQWCKDNFKYSNIIFVENNSAIEDLYIMSNCTNNITTNSSFSWWAAWLNKNLSKKIIAPKKWWTNSDEINSIIPKDWLVI